MDKAHWNLHVVLHDSFFLLFHTFLCIEMQVFRNIKWGRQKTFWVSSWRLVHPINRYSRQYWLRCISNYVLEHRGWSHPYHHEQRYWRQFYYLLLVLRSLVLLHHYNLRNQCPIRSFLARNDHWMYYRSYLHWGNGLGQVYWCQRCGLWLNQEEVYRYWMLFFHGRLHSYDLLLGCNYDGNFSRSESFRPDDLFHHYR